MIVGMAVLGFECREIGCAKRADFSVTRTNDELAGQRSPDGYPYGTTGQRTLAYCREHVPEDARQFWGLATYEHEKSSIEGAVI